MTSALAGVQVTYWTTRATDTKCEGTKIQQALETDICLRKQLSSLLCNKNYNKPFIGADKKLRKKVYGDWGIRTVIRS